MFDREDASWTRSAANELNNLLQVIAESGEFLHSHSGQDAEASKYFDMLRTAVERASRVTKAMLEKTGASVSESTGASGLPDGTGSLAAAGSATPHTSQRTGNDINIHNPNGPRELIMIVDDEDFVTLLAQRVLTEEGYRAITVNSGAKCLDVYKKLQNEIDLIILDFTMPIMDGSDVFNELRLIDPRVPVMLSSGFTEQDKLKWMLAKGLLGFIPKPYTQQKLLLQVRSVLDSIKNERA